MHLGFANDTFLRRFASDLKSPFISKQSLALLACTALFLGLIGPFGTYDGFPPIQRLFYWSLVVLGTASVGHAVSTAIERCTRSRDAAPLLNLVAIPMLTALPVCLVVALITMLFGSDHFWELLPVLYFQCVAVVACLVVLFQIVAPRVTQKPETTGRPKLLDRLPLSNRGRILRLKAQDHYVEVVTDRGRVLLPMRFKDAVLETAGEAGLQVHRSHWTAIHAVAGRCRVNDRPCLRLSDGGFVPVGRTFSKEVADALQSLENRS